MSTFLTEVRETLAPGRTAPFGPLPPLLVAMTLVTGLVDAFSYLVLGHVFVANMTGNVVFLGFAVAGAHGFSIPASLVALVSFGVGSVVGGQMVARFGHHRGRHLAIAMAVESVLLAASVVLALWSSEAPQHAFRYGLIVVLSLATGVQNASIRKLAVPDLTTTVLTMTVTGIGADSTLGGGKAPNRAGASWRSPPCSSERWWEPCWSSTYGSSSRLPLRWSSSRSSPLRATRRARQIHPGPGSRISSGVQ